MTAASSTAHAGAQGRPARSRGVRADIQGLRAFAVLVVIADHLFRWPAGGFVGVDVFFVVSGFLITAHMLRELDTSGRLSMNGFYRRRIRRIAPAATVTLAVTVAISLLVLPRPRAVSVAVDGVWAFFFGANWRFLSTGTDYFQLGQPPSPLQHFWSLSIEEQFYFVWPALTLGAFLLVMKRVSTRGRAILAIGGIYAALVAASFAWALVETAASPTVAYFSTFSRAWELGVGALLAALLHSGWRMARAGRIALAWVGVAGLVASVFVITPESAFPAPAAALPVLATALVILAGTGISDRRYDRALAPLTNRVSGYIGDISYSLYLWHFPVIVLLLAVLPGDSRRYYVAAVILTAVLSVLSYHFVEQPVRRSSWLLPGRAVDRDDRRRVTRIASAGAAAGFVVALLVLGGLRVAGPSSSTETPVADPDCLGAMTVPAAGPECAVAPATSAAGLTPSLDDLESDTAGGYACWRPQGGELTTCHYGSTADDALRVALVGDSHAAMLLPALYPILEERNWSLDTYVGYGCQWVASPSSSDCSAVMEEIQHTLLTSPTPYDAVLTTAARWAAPEDIAAAVEGYVDAWDPVAQAGSQVVVIADSPGVSEDALECLARLGTDPSECGTSWQQATEDPDPLIDASASVPGAVLVDMTDFYCEADWCPAAIGNAIVYRDTAGHVTGTYMKTLSPYLADRLADALDGAR